MAPRTSVSLVANANWQVCNDQACDLDAAELRLDLPTAPEPVANAAAATEITAARAAMPRVSDLWSATAANHGEKIVLTLTAKPGATEELGDIYFFSSDGQTDAQSEQIIQRTPGRIIITAARARENMLGDPIPQLPHISGIVSASNGWMRGEPATGLVLTNVALAESAPQSGAAAAGAGEKAPSFLGVLGGMFLGGMFLNLMPCVFPVIGIKIMGFVHQAGHDRRKVALHGIIFAIGVLLSFWVLAGLLFAGGITNWGNQMQDPRVILVTILILLLFGMNLFGVFEVGTAATGIGGRLTHKQGMAGTFFSGVLATVIATPCSGPFLSVAIGVAAATKSGPLFFLAFTLMGLGLALPYVLLSFFPKLVDKLPRPGAWMESFKQGMSFLLFAAAGVFLWVYSTQVFEHSDGQKGLWVMLGLAGVATAAWIYGRWSHPMRSGRARLLARGIALVLVVASVLIAWPWPEKASIWEDWSQAKVDKALAEGRPVFVDFTAHWCLTCQYNKQHAYTEEVLKLVKKRNVLMLRADKTMPNEEIDRKIRDLGRSLIPVNVLYEPGAAPVITPPLLSPGILLELFSKGAKTAQP
jgi:thiol:disulfide interchange protein DsbD